MNVTTWLGFLCGDGASILLMCRDVESLYAGLAFVASAGVARNYLRRDLTEQPWLLFLPLVASTGTAFLLYSLFATLAWAYKAVQPSFVRGFSSLLGLYWLTAPLAWIYGFPFERIFSRVGAVKARLAALGLVSVWRVTLMVRVMYVVLDARDEIPFHLVMIFASSVTLLAIFLTWRTDREASYPGVISMMGGLDSEDRPEVVLVGTTSGCVVPLAVLALLGCSLAALERSNDVAAWKMRRFHLVDDSTSVTGLLGFALASLFVWCCALPSAQRKQRLRRHTESIFSKGEIVEGLKTMSLHNACHYPDQWEPPPSGRFVRTASQIHLLNIWETILEHPIAEWCRNRYLEQLREFVSHPECYWTNEHDLARLTSLLERIPEGTDFASLAILKINHLAEYLKMFDSIEEKPAIRDEQTDFGSRDFISRSPKDSLARQQTMLRLQQLADSNTS